MNIYQDLENYTEALASEEYLIRLIHLDRENHKPIKRIWAKETLLESIKFLQAKNCEGYNIYARPVGYEFVLLDDLSRAMLVEVAKIQPAVLIETSPQNYQVWLKLEEKPETREQALAICKYLAQDFLADMGSAEPDHVGRLPSFTNRKPKYQSPNGNFPFCKLHKYADRYSSFSTQSVPCAKKKEKENLPKKTIKQTNHTGIDQSRIDFNLACMLIRQKKSDNIFMIESKNNIMLISIKKVIIYPEPSKTPKKQ